MLVEEILDIFKLEVEYENKDALKYASVGSPLGGLHDLVVKNDHMRGNIHFKEDPDGNKIVLYINLFLRNYDMPH